MKWLFTTLLLTLLPTLTIGQYAEQIMGTILDENGLLMEGVVVLFKETQEITETNFQGQFLFDVTGFKVQKNTKHGFYFVKPGYQPLDVDLVIEPLDNIVLKKETKNGFWVHAVEKSRSTKIIYSANISVYTGQFSYETLTDQNGFAFVELPKDINVYQPVRLTCRGGYRYEQYSEDLILADIKEVKEINLRLKRNLTFTGLHNDFLLTLKQISQKAIGKDRIDAMIKNEMEELNDLYEGIRRLSNLTPEENDKKCRYYTCNNAFFKDILLQTTWQLGKEYNLTKIKMHNATVENFMNKIEDFLQNSQKVNGHQIPQKIDELMDLGMEIIQIKFIIAAFSREAYRDIESDLNELEKLVDFEIQTLKKYNHKIPDKTRENYRISIEENTQKLEDLIQNMNHGGH